MSKKYDESVIFFSELFDRLFPILRSITGPGLRESYDIIGEYLPLEKLHVATGTKVFDWTVPKEWSCDEAYLIGPDNQRIVDMKDNNLHVLNYSVAVNGEFSLEELQSHLFSIENLPEAIPYVSSYYQERWGFCMTHAQRMSLKEGTYRAVIKSQHVNGGIDLVQTTLPGESKKEILISSYLCHPSLANNELSGPLVLLGLYHRIKNWSNRRYTYRFVLHPETIGSLCLMHLEKDEILEKCVGGIVLNMLGGERPNITFKHSIMENGPIDKVVRYMCERDKRFVSLPYDPNSGADERNYAMPGFRLPICNASRDFYHGNYIGYHNSLDTKESMQIEKLMESIDTINCLLKVCDDNVVYENLAPYGEPQLGPRGLYPTINNVNKTQTEAEAEAHRELCLMKWILALSDRKHDLIEISKRAEASVEEVSRVARKLKDKGLLRKINRS